MSGTKQRVRGVVVTGANSGLGFEAAAQFAAAGYDSATLVCRTLDKAQDAKARLAGRNGQDVFHPVGADIADLASVDAAAGELIAAGRQFDVLVLNAGVMPSDKSIQSRDGYDIAYAAALVGHHRLTMRLIDAKLLANGARIVIAGSEAARGDVPGISLPDYRRTATTEFGGDVEATLSAYLRGDMPRPRAAMSVYAMSKLMVAWWAASLSRQLPAGTTVNAISPGGTPATNFARNASIGMRAAMSVMSVIGPPFGLMHTVRTGARRYLDAASFGDEVNGQFLASRPKKFTGALVPVTTPAVLDEEAQAALWSILSASSVAEKPVGAAA